MAVEKPAASRLWIARAFTIIEDLVYIGLGLLLAASAVALLINSFLTFVSNIRDNTLPVNVVTLLDRMLLVLLIVELLYTVQVSIREHSIAPEPFLLVGVIAGIRRVLVVTAEFGHVPQLPAAVLQGFLYELAVLTLLILTLVVSLILLRRNRLV
ncbi:MAG TPA: phosphate-starvation-inducible PsiE family protein [Thermoanaerobaculia bacterium]|jgi:uncharacterized membrane protein (DUF373 family)